ncbi:prohead protease/major capsid protein fusion protein [Chitinophaga sp. CF418]|uniref:prohead protease/major capsid protein fusion protein n=1 Tax=Chitinophaga sp. CF418 TaxID=1855287 RepID=UPI00091205E9|nr:prohead protease/major capsid protein fusion protein [Chitinophaga sp. CF418]SHN42253.1 prohead serine protease [Chitinophaga sp. CF418]
MSRTEKQTEKFYSRALVDSASIVETEAGERFFDVVFATETPVFRKAWEESFNEILLCEKRYIRTGRLDENAVPLLDNHDRYTGVLGQYGSVVSYEIKDRQCRATIRFSTREDLTGIWNDIRAGIIKSISVGYNVYKYIREVSAEDKAIPNYKAADWEPIEISLAPVPADFRSKIRSDEYGGHNITIENYSLVKNTRTNMEGENAPVTEPVQNTMPATHATRIADPVTAPAPTAAPTESSDQMRADGIASERKRIIDISNAVRAAGLPIEFSQTLINNGTQIDAARAVIIDELAKTGNPVSGGPSASARGDENQLRRKHMVDGIMHRAMPGSVKDLSEQAREYRHLSLLNLARHTLDVNGEKAYRLSDAEVVTRAFATTDFPDLLSNTTERFLRYFYEQQNFAWKQLAAAKSNKDFRTSTGVAVDGKITFDKVGENGEFKHSSLITNDKATTKLQTFGNVISIGRQAIINDDLDIFKELPKLIAQGAGTLQAKMFWDLVTGNAKAADGKALFHADHNNLASGAAIGAPSIDTLSAGRVAMWRQTTPTGGFLAVKAKYFVVPAELETKAEQLMAAITANEVAKVNGFTGKYEILVDPHLTDPKEWYLAADPNEVEGIVYAYLSGQEGLNIDSIVDPKKQTVDTVSSLDFDTKVWGYRGWYKNPGA